MIKLLATAPICLSSVHRYERPEAVEVGVSEKGAEAGPCQV